jgi:hypothetical protein
VGHPDIFDTDHDGNTVEWMGGWQFIYMLDKTTGAPSRTWVWSNPLSVDGDGDTLSDALERVYGYNPGVKSNLNVLTLDSQLNERDAWGETTASDGMVLPGQTLYYTAKVTNRLLSREAEGLLSTEAASGISTGASERSFVLRPQEQSETSRPVERFRRRGGRRHDVTQVAGAPSATGPAPPGGMLLWLPFNDPNTPWFDRSGNQPPHDGACFDGQGQTPWRGCTLDANGAYGNGLKLDG